MLFNHRSVVIEIIETQLTLFCDGFLPISAYIPGIRFQVVASSVNNKCLPTHHMLIALHELIYLISLCKDCK